MTASYRRLAAACLVLVAVLFVSVPYALADNCRTIDDEQAEASGAGYFVIKDHAGTSAKAFIDIFNNVTPPQVGDVDADQLRVYGREDLSFVIISFLKQGCLVDRLRVPMMIYRQVDLETARHLADDGKAS